MSESVLAFVITISLLIAAVLWVPFLHLCSRCKPDFSRKGVTGTKRGSATVGDAPSRYAEFSVSSRISQRADRASRRDQDVA